jgi:hypothetical protein
MFHLTDEAPPPRVDIENPAIAESGVATLGRVAVSGKKRGGDIYHLGKERAHARYGR